MVVMYAKSTLGNHKSQSVWFVSALIRHRVNRAVETFRLTIVFPVVSRCCSFIDFEANAHFLNWKTQCLY